MSETGWRKPAGQVSLAGSSSQHCCSGDGFVLEEAARFLRPGFSRRRRLHGPGQLGHRSGGRRKIWLRAVVRRHDLQLHGDPAAAFVHQTRRRHRTRSRPSLPRSLFEADSLVSLDSLRNRHCRVRSGRSGRLGHRACNFSSAFRWCGVAALPRSMCWPFFICSKKVFVTSRRWSSR